ncbi:MAG: aspartate/glutamate racemase family protein [Pseudomonadota bacterium]
MKLWYQSYVDYENGAKYWDALRLHLDAIRDPETSIDIKGITPFDSYAHPVVEWRCAREMMVQAVQAEREGYDAFIVGHFQDSGLYEVRSMVDIPVVALGEASMLYACQLGQRIGLVTLNERFVAGHLHQIRKYGFEHRVTGVHGMAFEPGQLMDAIGNAEKVEAARQVFEAQGQPLVESGIDILIPAGGIPMLAFSGIKDHRVGAAPVINGIPIVVKMAEMAVKLRRLTGLSVSRVSDYVKAPDHVIDEFQTHPKGL